MLSFLLDENLPPSLVGRYLLDANLPALEKELEEGVIVIVEENSIRIRKLPIKR